MTVINSIADRAPDLRDWRHELHRHPELGYEEVWTSDFIAGKLESFGIEVHRGMGKTGVVGVLRGTGDSDRAIGLRSDIDALPIHELNEFDHASLTPGKMHACGHDGHTTMLLGAAQYLAETRNFDGTVYFIFQPAEEGGAGGLAMIEDGLFTKFEMETVWGLHNWPSMDAGSAGIHDGVCMANADMFEMTVTGLGGHAAQPHMTVDPVPCGAAIVQALQTIVSRRVSPVDSAVVSVTVFQAGSAHNVIPDSAKLQGTARSFTAETRKLLEEAIRDIADLDSRRLWLQPRFRLASRLSGDGQPCRRGGTRRRCDGSRSRGRPGGARCRTVARRRGFRLHARGTPRGLYLARHRPGRAGRHAAWRAL